MINGQLRKARQPLQDMFAATIELTSNVIARPASEHALANVKAISSFVRFLETLKYKKGCDLTRLLNGCTILEKVAKDAVMGEQSTHYEAVRVYHLFILLAHSSLMLASSSSRALPAIGCLRKLS